MANKLLKYTKGDQDYLVCCGTEKFMTQDGSTLVDNNYFFIEKALTLSQVPGDTFQGINLNDVGNRIDVFFMIGGQLYGQICTITDGRISDIDSPELMKAAASDQIVFGKGYMAQQTLSYNGSRWVWNKHLTQLYMPQTDNFFCVKLKNSSDSAIGWAIEGNNYGGSLTYVLNQKPTPSSPTSYYFIDLILNWDTSLSSKAVIIVKNHNGYHDIFKNYLSGNEELLYVTEDTYDWVRKDGCEIHVWFASYNTIMTRVAVLQNMNDPDFDYQLFETAAMNLKVPCIKFIYTPKYDGSDTEGWIAC